jgi:hypothetical protein
MRSHLRVNFITKKYFDFIDRLIIENHLEN